MHIVESLVDASKRLTMGDELRLVSVRLECPPEDCVRDSPHLPLACLPCNRQQGHSSACAL